MMDIDVVILWVDGSDPAWLRQKQEYLPPAAGDSNSANRYRDWGILPYWFRAIETFAPWVRKIHFVTWGHVPGFLNLDAPKLHVVRHDEFIPTEYLPTFSSHAIEMNIHRIPGLAEHFIYFNDDMFLLRPHEQSDFFRDGLPCTCGREVPWSFRGSVGIWSHAAANDLGVVNAHFSKKEVFRRYRKKFCGRTYHWKDNLRTFALNILFPDYFTGFKNLHAPAAYRKKTFEEVWTAEPKLLDNTCRNKFRAASDVNQWVCLWWQVASGQFQPYEVDNLVKAVTPGKLEQACRAIENQAHAMICVNDPDGDVDFEAMAAALRQSFEKILPQKSSYEK